jgi:hypothetical protein
VSAVSRRAPDERTLIPIVDRLVDQRYAAAVDAVARLRAEDPTADPGPLADRLIRRCARDLAVGGAVSGGAAASPVSGVAVAAASAGADATYSMGRLSEMIMGLGLVYGHDHPSAEERAGWIWAVLGLSEGAAVGLTGLAARVGARSGARLVSRLPTGAPAAANATVGRRMMSKLSNGKGPWSLAALVPYGIGAGVGAAGNAVLAQSVGRAAKQYFAGKEPGVAAFDPVVEDGGEGEIVDEPASAAPPRPRHDDEIVDAVIVVQQREVRRTSD